ncbi:MAG: hypothetical protein EOO36_01745 [Cytophagaceae bacterium]|nr:MAG: hypothetical protein EOO36_01745 [Cytophagaceae bacterium]
MKFLPTLLVALVLPTSAALAQTVLPSGAVAPAGAVAPTTGVEITPGTVPGAQPAATPGLRRRASRHDEDAPGMSHADRKRLRKMGKVKYNSNSSKPSGQK